jgi:hypothetical protein
MGDHRASLKIEWSMHGHECKQDFWYNYYPTDECCTCKVDRRILDWLTTQYEISMDNWFEAECADAERKAAKAENDERTILAELTKKYGRA